MLVRILADQRTSVPIVRRRSHREMETAGREIVDVKIALATAKADFEARQQELRFVIGEARKREDEAKARVKECEVKLAELEDRLRSVLEEKGRLQNEATRVEETKAISQGEIQSFTISRPESRIWSKRRPKQSRMQKPRVCGLQTL